jgi:hypothetical protein
MNRMKHLPEGATQRRIFFHCELSRCGENSPSSALKLARDIIYGGKSKASF